MKDYDIDKIEKFLEKELNNIFTMQRNNLYKNQNILKNKLKKHVKTLKRQIRSKKIQKNYNKIKNKSIKNIINSVPNKQVRKYANKIDNKELKKINLSKNSSFEDVIKLIMTKMK
jgi:hypothetical protein